MVNKRRTSNVFRERTEINVFNYSLAPLLQRDNAEMYV